MKYTHLLLAALALLISPPSEAGSKKKEVCKTYTGSATTAGTSGTIYIKTNCFFSVRKGQLYLHNPTKDEHGTVTSTAAGLHDWPIPPGAEEYHTLAVYTKPGQSIKVDLEVTWCKQEWVQD
jgi:hypothetical protein